MISLLDTPLSNEPKTPFGIRVEALTKRFGQETILAGIEFEIQPGEFTVLVGPSGCGKTTLLRMIGGLESITDGAIELTIQNEVVSRQLGDQIGYCFQEPRLLPWRTVIDNVALPLELRGMDESTRTERAREILALVGLTDDHAKLPHQLSGGMQMRVAIARALVTRPKLLLLDEPFAALDEINRARLDDELLRLWSETGVTVVMVTHSLTEAVYLGETIHIMASHPGRIADTIRIDLPVRSPGVRSQPEFVQWVALAHGMLAAQGHGD